MTFIHLPIVGIHSLSGTAATRSRYHAGIGDTMAEVISQSLDLLATMISANQYETNLKSLRHEVRGAWQEGRSLPWDFSMGSVFRDKSKRWRPRP